MDGRCAWPSIETVAAACFCGTRTAYRAVTRLVELGYMRENPDQSWNARDPETGRLVRRGYRSKVYDVLVENFNRLDDEGQTERARDIKGDTIPDPDDTDDATDTIDAGTVGHEAADGVSAGVRDESDGPAGETCQNGRPGETPTVPTFPETCQNGRPETGQAGQPCQNGNGTLPKWQATNKGLTNSPSVPYGDISPDGGDDATGDGKDRHGDGEAPSAGVGEWDDYRPPEPEAWQTDHTTDGTDDTGPDTGRQAGPDVGETAMAILRHLTERQTARGLVTGRQTSRDRRALAGLTAKHGAETVLTDLDWALDDPFWAARTTGGRAFARHWTQIHNQRLMDATRTHDDNPDRDRAAGTGKPHRHTWACKHTLAVLGATDPANVDMDQAMQVAIRLNREADQTTDPDREETR
ncbi:helix-turn-helix domain-containing protein [uncultured Bifidobacterium sp.]|uniref:helix-turn-helix domain-containing protein n=1 Tax=uncultured Bifidobacterium sp. TaxID=165187 RepID=UPI002629BD0C|nr:helix-turn-helix domain-containing protein [uncultured Bifidobacterium sp.]